MSSINTSSLFQGVSRGAKSAGYRGAKSAGYRGAKSAGYRGAKSAGYRGAKSAGYRGAKSAGYRGADTAAPLRIVLLPGEALRIPRGRSTVRILSGTAWLTSEGKDIILSKAQCPDCDEQCQSMTIANEAPVISGVGSEAMLFEVC